ncbi:hypothetical protein C8Q80DRAFT_794676 [Daedaleopsis nitida]|nr:hypothetical protein C8Q80DRAFT_794676 [Daedaleopsis nitida]
MHLATYVVTYGTCSHPARVSLKLRKSCVRYSNLLQVVCFLSSTATTQNTLHCLFSLQLSGTTVLSNTLEVFCCICAFRAIQRPEYRDQRCTPNTSDFRQHFQRRNLGAWAGRLIADQYHDTGVRRTCTRLPTLPSSSNAGKCGLRRKALHYLPPQVITSPYSSGRSRRDVHPSGWVTAPFSRPLLLRHRSTTTPVWIFADPTRSGRPTHIYPSRSHFRSSLAAGCPTGRRGLVVRGTQRASCSSIRLRMEFVLPGPFPRVRGLRVRSFAEEAFRVQFAIRIQWPMLTSGVLPFIGPLQHVALPGHERCRTPAVQRVCLRRAAASA